MHVSAHIDTFARDMLPPRHQWPELLFEMPQFAAPPVLNCAAALIDSAIERGHGDAPAVLWDGGCTSYAALHAAANRIARVLVEDFGLVTGNRVLLHGANSAVLAACWLAVMKAGGVAVTTMPLLRAGELGAAIGKARVSHALCEEALLGEVARMQAVAPNLRHVVGYHSLATDGLEARMAGKAPSFAAVPTASDDVALIAFTSGTTGAAKGTMHFHRDVLAICDGFSRQILAPTSADIFIGTPPFAFTFGLGGLLLFPLRAGAATVLHARYGAQELLAAIARHRATICFTAPTMYARMAPLAAGYDLSSLRIAVASGEHLAPATRAAWRDATGNEPIECFGTTEMLHAFMSASASEARPGSAGKALAGYRICILGDHGQPLPAGSAGRLAVKGPVGCRYLDDARQRDYVRDGWNLTGDAGVLDADDFFWFHSRTDDLIVTSGHNVGATEVEDALLTHPAVAECGVVGIPDAARGQIVKAVVVPAANVAVTSALAAELQAHVKAAIAPYKYPRAIAFAPSLPRTGSGKLQRSLLRDWGAQVVANAENASPARLNDSEPSAASCS
ncbi:MAG: AMP-binding protein [Proteobacteria bacterium]|nr:AMP-binding protein [Pseudomonadota bacterium]